jgi:hypothetical protein
MKVSSFALRWVARSLLLAALVLTLSSAATADTPTSDESQVTSTTPADQAARRVPPKPGQGKKDELPKFEEVTKEHQEVAAPPDTKGMWSLQYREKDDHLLAVIPHRMLGENFLIASSIAAGGPMSGYMWGSTVVQWQEMDKKLVLVAPELRYERNKKSEVDDVVGRTYTDRILTSVPILTKRGKDPVISLDDLFKNDFAGAARVFGGRIDRSLTRWDTRKVFPQNIELEVDYAVMRGSMGGTRGRVHFSIVELPKNDYKPREADDRIGYFLTAKMDWSRDHNAETLFKRYIHRWDVRKAQPDKAVSDVDPDHQIVFYIEKTVPVKYRPYVRAGILEWNKAFEKAGIRNAIRVEQQTDTMHADKDPEDVRYAFFRWIVSGRSFAMGPSLANPLTGEILDADIIFDDSMVRVWEHRYGNYTGTGLGFGDDDPQLRAWLDENPEWDWVPLHDQLFPANESAAHGEHAIPHELLEEVRHQPGYCTCAEGLAYDMAFNLACFEATGNAELGEQYVCQMIKEVVTHEVGHTLGLRHNFKASSWKSIADILNNKDSNVATCASVMDYNPALFAPEQGDGAVFVTQTVGPYDIWAIEYGYAAPDGEKFKNEKDLLKSITARVGEPGHAYATDEDTGYFAPDPLVNRFDMGSNVLDYAEHRMGMVRRVQTDMADWALKDGDSYYKLRRTFNTLLGEYGRASGFAARYVGGQYLSRAHKGDPDAPAPIEIVSAKKQREALEFLIENVLTDEHFNFDPDLLNRLAAGRWSHWGSDAMDRTLDYPVHDRIAGIQYSVLAYLLNPMTLNRVYDAELKVPADKDAFTVPELLDRLTKAVWSELDQPVGGNKYDVRNPYISSIRRNLQRLHLRTMLNIVLSRPGSGVNADVHAVACMKLNELSERIGPRLADKEAKGLDDFSRAHLDEVKSRIDRALEAKYLQSR